MTASVCQFACSILYLCVGEQDRKCKCVNGSMETKVSHRSTLSFHWSVVVITGSLKREYLGVATPSFCWSPIELTDLVYVLLCCMQVKRQSSRVWWIGCLVPEPQMTDKHPQSRSGFTQLWLQDNVIPVWFADPINFRRPYLSGLWVNSVSSIPRTCSPSFSPVLSPCLLNASSHFIATNENWVITFWQHFSKVIPPHPPSSDFFSSTPPFLLSL